MSLITYDIMPISRSFICEFISTCSYLLMLTMWLLNSWKLIICNYCMPGSDFFLESWIRIKRKPDIKEPILTVKQDLLDIILISKIFCTFYLPSCFHTKALIFKKFSENLTLGNNLIQNGARLLGHKVICQENNLDLDYSHKKKV